MDKNPIMRLFYISLFFLFIHCSKGKPIHIDLQQREREENLENEEFSDSDSTNVLNFGITPWDDPEKLKIAYKPFIKYLSTQLGTRVRFIVEQDFEQLQSDINSNLIQIAAFTPGAYVDALEKYPRSMIYVATTMKNGVEAYKGMLVVRDDSNFKSIKDLKNKKMGFVDPGSSSGYLYPVALLLKEGIDPDKFFQSVFFLGNHPNITDALVAGTIDVGATWSDNFEEAQKKHNYSLRILMKTDPIPYDAIVVSQKAGQELASKLSVVLSKINIDTKNEEGKPIMGAENGLLPYTGFRIKSPDFYNVVRSTSTIVSKYEQSKKK